MEHLTNDSEADMTLKKAEIIVGLNLGRQIEEDLNKQLAINKKIAEEKLNNPTYIDLSDLEEDIENE